MPRRTIAIAVLLGTSVLTAAGCTAGAPLPSPPPTRAAGVAPTGDGVLRLGTEFPASGADAASGPAQVAGVEIAVREINDAGGVLDAPIVVHHRDSGDESTDRAEQSAADLLTRSVDALMGPSNSALASRISAAAPAIPVISTATSGDGAMVFGATAPPIAAMAAIAGSVAGGDAANVALLLAADGSGEAARGALVSALEDTGGQLVSAQPATTKGVAAVVEADPEAVVLAVPASDAVLEALDDAGLGGDRLWIAPATDVSAARAGILEGAATLAPVADEVFAARVRAADPAVTDPGLAAQAYDATIAAALAAVVAADDGGPSIASRLVDVTEGGIPCRSFAQCLDVLSTESDIDYDGVSGPLDLDESGTPTRGSYAVLRYDAANQSGATGDTVG